MKGPGYKVEDCKGVRPDVSSKLVERVKKVVSTRRYPRLCLRCRSRALTLSLGKIESEHKRVADKRDKKPPKPVIPVVPAIPAFSGQRKGG